MDLTHGRLGLAPTAVPRLPFSSKALHRYIRRILRTLMDHLTPHTANQEYEHLAFLIGLTLPFERGQSNWPVIPN